MLPIYEAIENTGYRSVNITWYCLKTTTLLQMANSPLLSLSNGKCNVTSVCYAFPALRIETPCAASDSKVPIGWSQRSSSRIER